MPSYQNVTPPISLMPGDVGFSFNNEAFPGGAQAGSQFAIPSYAGQPDTGTAVRWQTIFGTAPTAVSPAPQPAKPAPSPACRPNSCASSLSPLLAALV